MTECDASHPETPVLHDPLASVTPPGWGRESHLEDVGPSMCEGCSIHGGDFEVLIHGDGGNAGEGNGGNVAGFHLPWHGMPLSPQPVEVCTWLATHIMDRHLSISAVHSHIFNAPCSSITFVNSWRLAALLCHCWAISFTAMVGASLCLAMPLEKHAPRAAHGGLAPPHVTTLVHYVSCFVHYLS